MDFFLLSVVLQWGFLALIRFSDKASFGSELSSFIGPPSIENEDTSKNAITIVKVISANILYSI